MIVNTNLEVISTIDYLFHFHVCLVLWRMKIGYPLGVLVDRACGFCLSHPSMAIRQQAIVGRIIVNHVLLSAAPWSATVGGFRSGASHIRSQF